ncbi:hypothetical protein CC85DRAFT_314077 [Cutaneotrichosporon oleaginosum]|uniref:Uncharacterized protein n=1 Tax=Cutaneotrichosporon oleaginosum TaxID=879819 RepID=A0A0J0XD94_9TREE|nr:uncharacterized protein CC85DRAFT_314077 [Cutaneotrichosporon oleaginosum]KLT39046.1 hypothetical protein CC85DRAFT_314077 [Cutaneotrichosporon oleaginosum]TXT11831.1 hypothetical protein COLE_02241 [Cutaneotrichosporon oleaginosum]
MPYSRNSELCSSSRAGKCWISGARTGGSRGLGLGSGSRDATDRSACAESERLAPIFSRTTHGAPTALAVRPTRAERASVHHVTDPDLDPDPDPDPPDPGPNLSAQLHAAEPELARARPGPVPVRVAPYIRRNGSRPGW